MWEVRSARRLCVPAECKVSRSTCLKAETTIQDRLPGLREDLKKLAADPAVKDVLAEKTRKGAGRTSR